MVWSKGEFKVLKELENLKKEHKIQYYLIWIALPKKYKDYLDKK